LLNKKTAAGYDIKPIRHNPTIASYNFRFIGISTKNSRKEIFHGLFLPLNEYFEIKILKRRPLFDN